MIVSDATIHPEHLLSFFFNDPATTEIYTLSLHDALPISHVEHVVPAPSHPHHAAREHPSRRARSARRSRLQDRKSTRLNSSHSQISYAVFCLKKKKRLRKTSPIALNWLQIKYQEKNLTLI